MDYKEKIRLGTLYAKELKEGKSIESIESSLKEKGYYQLDIRKVLQSAKKELEEKLTEKMTNHLLAETPLIEEKEIGILDEGVYSYIKGKVVKEIKKNSKKQINRYVDAGHGVVLNDIPNVINPFFSEIEAMEHYLFYKKNNPEAVGKKKNIHYFLGATSIAIGALLTFASFSGGSGKVYYGLILVGIIAIGRGYGIEVKNRVDY